MHPARKTLRIVAVGILAAGLSLWGYFAYLDWSGNFATVVAGEVYRSNQVTPEELASYTQAVGLRSVLNLRGAAPGESWYDAEVAASDRLGLVHADFAMDGTVDLSDSDAARLVALMRDLPKPLLVHCQRGADRTGLAMALYMGAIRGEAKGEAGGQLSIRYGHVGVPYLSNTYPMDESWDRLARLFGVPEG